MILIPVKSIVRLAISLGLLLGSIHGWHTSTASAQSAQDYSFMNVNSPGSFHPFGSDSLSAFP